MKEIIERLEKELDQYRKKLDDLKFIRQELFEAYEMNDRILVGYALNRLDTYLNEVSK